MSTVLSVYEMELLSEGGVVSCRVCRRRLRDADRGLKAHYRALHPWVFAQKREPLKPGQMVIENPQSRFAKIVSAHHYAPDGSWVSSLRECTRSDGRPKKEFKSMVDAEKAAEPLGNRYHGYECTNGHFHVGRRYV